MTQVSVVVVLMELRWIPLSSVDLGEKDTLSTWEVMKVKHEAEYYHDEEDDEEPNACKEE